MMRDTHTHGASVTRSVSHVPGNNGNRQPARIIAEISTWLVVFLVASCSSGATPMCPLGRCLHLAELALSRLIPPRLGTLDFQFGSTVGIGHVLLPDIRSLSSGIRMRAVTSSSNFSVTIHHSFPTLVP